MSHAKEEEAFLMNLLDFSNFPSKRNDVQGKWMDVENISPVDKNGNFDSKNAHQFQSFDELQSGQNHQSQEKQLLRTFSNLRDKLNISQRENISLQSENQSLSKEVDSFKCSQQKMISQLQGLSKQNASLQSENNQYKQRLIALKQQNQSQEQSIEQSQSLQMKIVQLNQQIQNLKQEKNKSMELAISEKISLEDELKTLKLRLREAKVSMEEAENELHTKSKECIKWENEFKKIKLLYDEQLYTKRLQGQEVILTRQNEDLRKKCEDLEDKYRKQKNKKYQLQEKLLELEERVRLYGTKTDIYQGEIQTMSKRMKKVEKEQSQAQNMAHHALHEKLSWEEKFYNSTILCEELIARVKRELVGDLVELAKSCEFRLNKLKNDQKVEISNFKREKSCKKLNKKAKRSKTTQVKHIDHLNRCSNQEEQMLQTDKSHEVQSNLLKNHGQRVCSQTVKKSSPYIAQSEKEFTATNTKRRLFDNQKNNKETEQETVTKSENETLEAKIRREREQMERKLRQKVLFHRIEDTTNESSKNKLRDEYLKLAVMDI